MNRYESIVFRGLEASAIEAKGLIKAENYEVEEDYIDEVEFISEQVSLAEDLSLIKGEYFDDQGEEERDGEILLHEF